MDKHFIATFSEKKEMLRQYRDIPMALRQLYRPDNMDYIKDRHGNDLQVTLEIPQNIPNAPQAAG